MKTIRARFTLLTALAVIISTLSIGLISIASIRVEEDSSARERLLLICQNEKQQMDAYLNSIEQSVQTVARFASNEVNREGVDIVQHLALVDSIFQSIAENTNGAMSYYYRISPEASDTALGFFYTRQNATRQNATSFTSMPLTDLSAYPADDISHVGWYTIPRKRGVPSWLDPYYNENLGLKIISYVAPVYRHGVFFGVIGMDFKYSILVNQVNDITVYDTGYAFLVDDEGKIIYHPTLPIGSELSSYSEALVRDKRGHQLPIVRYEYKDVKKRATFSELSNGMFLYITAPESEINAGWLRLIRIILEATVILLSGGILLTTMIVNRITNPLRRLTEAARQVDAGNYDVKLDYTRGDEVGILTGVFHQLIDHLKSYIEDLNSKAYTDALTSVRNKGAFTLYARKLQDRLTMSEASAQDFAICMFDCNDLKGINDQYGHDKGDIYLTVACRLICRVYQHSPVFRLGGDEFAACLQGEDYLARETLAQEFARQSAQINASATVPWERASIARGMAVFNPARDKTVEDVLRRADTIMYQEKRRMKAEGTPEEPVTDPGSGG